MSGVILDQITSVEAIMANFQRLNEALTAMQGGSISLTQITGYEDLVTETEMASELSTLRTEVEKLRYGVGDVHISTRSTNPKNYFGYGTWALTGSGRALIGHGTTTDSRGEKKTLTAGQAGGEFNHKLTPNEMPRHGHTAKDVFTSGGGGGYDSGPGHNPRTITTSEAGGDAPHNNMQPYLVVYFWKRTA